MAVTPVSRSSIKTFAPAPLPVDRDQALVHQAATSAAHPKSICAYVQTLQHAAEYVAIRLFQHWPVAPLWSASCRFRVTRTGLAPGKHMVIFQKLPRRHPSFEVGRQAHNQSTFSSRESWWHTHDEMPPESGLSSPNRHPIKVDLPAPFGPISPKISPSYMSSVNP